MSENNAVARGGNGNPRVEVEALLALVRNQFPTLATGAAITTEIVNQVTESIRRNIGLLGSGLTATSLAVLLPSLAIAIVNAIGFTAGGIAAGVLVSVFIYSRTDELMLTQDQWLQQSSQHFMALTPPD